MRKGQIFALICSFVLLYFSGVCQAQEKYPNRPIELVIPFGPGGGSDLSVRIYSEELARTIKVPITVVNRPGGSGIQGTSYVTRAKKDGYTLLATPGNTIVIMPIISNEVTYDPLMDLIPLGYFGSVPPVFSVKSDSPFKSFEELIEYARKNPGKLKNALGGLGTQSYFNQVILCAKNDIKITAVPFKSGAESVVALMGGHTDMSTNNLVTQGAQIKAGKIRGLAITSKTRDPNFPDIPTTAELGYPYVNFSEWFGVFAPAGVPQSVLDVLIPAIEKAFKNPEVVDRATKANLIVEYMGPREFRSFIESEFSILKKIAKDIGLSKK